QRSSVVRTSSRASAMASSFRERGRRGHAVAELTNSAEDREFAYRRQGSTQPAGIEERGQRLGRVPTMKGLPFRRNPMLTQLVPVMVCRSEFVKLGSLISRARCRPSRAAAGGECEGRAGFERVGCAGVLSRLYIHV